jgi:Kdo2-lipid IVA lauroyltransferase/acyltransferase
MPSVFKALSALPLWLLHAFGWLLGWVVFAASSGYRQRFLAHAAQAGYGFAAVRGAVGQAGCLTMELPRIWLGASPRYEWRDLEVIDRAYQSGKGVLLLTPHLGCFEIMAQALAARYSAAHGPLTVLYRPARKAWLAEMEESSRDRPGLKAVPTTLAGVRDMIKALRRGEAVGLLPDQVPPDGLGQWVPFFGRDAYTMTLAARLAQQTGALPLLVWSERLPWGRGYRLHFRDFLQPIGPELAPALLQINQEMERLIRECPQQYLWSYARYKQPKAEA